MYQQLTVQQNSLVLIVHLCLEYNYNLEYNWNLRVYSGPHEELIISLQKNAQPLFGDVIVFLADHGFEFIDFISLHRWERDAFNGLGQCMIGDALFLRTPEKFLEQCPVKKSVSSYLAILLLYRRFDLIDKTLLVLSADLRREYKAFSDAIIPIRKSHYFNFRITRFLDYFLSVVKSDYHNHLMY